MLKLFTVILLFFSTSIFAISHFNISKSNKVETKGWQKYQFSIKHAFFKDGIKSGVPYDLLLKTYRVLSKVSNIDKSLQKKDKFILVSKGKKLLSAHHINRNHRIDVYFYQGKYYDKKGFLIGKYFSHPLKTYTRISSRFSKRRFHPILKEYKGHNGTDYAAPIGTPIYAARDGVVRFASTMRGFGKVVYINHDKKYTTVYAHMSKIHPKIKEGKFIKRGTIIGYVGQTGWATGPHLHFETRIYNVAKNSRPMIGHRFIQKKSISFKRFTQQVSKINQFITD